MFYCCFISHAQWFCYVETDTKCVRSVQYRFLVFVAVVFFCLSLHYVVGPILGWFGACVMSFQLTYKYQIITYYTCNSFCLCYSLGCSTICPLILQSHTNTQSKRSDFVARLNELASVFGNTKSTTNKNRWNNNKIRSNRQHKLSIVAVTIGAN